MSTISQSAPPPTAGQLAQTTSRWLFKSEPDTRLEKGKDISFGIDKFEKLGVSTWDGVRNGQASGFMRERMKMGHKALFYHSSCAVPGVAGLAEICKEAYPDHTAFDTASPYHDPKSDKAKPRWYMVDVKFVSRLQHFVPLAVLQKFIGSGLTSEQRKGVGYLSDEQIQKMKEMPLLMPGRLSVQPVPPIAYDAIVLMGERGGFEDWLPRKGRKSTKGKPNSPSAKSTKEMASVPASTATQANKRGGKRKAEAASEGPGEAKEATAKKAKAEKGRSSKSSKVASIPAATTHGGVDTGKGLRRSSRTKR